MYREGSGRAEMLALDLGASNGRAMLGTLDDGRLSLEETFRFPNEPLYVDGHWCWDIPRLLSNIKDSLAAGGHRVSLDSVGIDCWGVDYGLIDSGGNLVGRPRHYRDEQTSGMREVAFSRIPQEQLYRETGNAFERYNTLFQILGMIAEGSGILDRADSLLLMADLFVYLLTGAKRTEFTAATTTQLVGAGSREWNRRVLTSMGIPDRLFSPIELPGSVRGELRTSRETGLGSVPIIAVGHHDTASAIAGIPGLEKGHAFLSSGTWSLIGMEVSQPILDTRAMELGYTNEGCVDGGYRFLQNIMGLWILQECKRIWDSQGGIVSFEELSALAETAPAFTCFIDPANEVFFAPGDMPRRVREYCSWSGQTVPDGRAAIVRCILESLALKYRAALESLEEVSGQKISVLHVVGGGSRNRLLNQFTASSIKRPLFSGPEEAAALGNITVQAMSLGAISNLQEGRKIIGASVQRDEYVPHNSEAWDEAYQRFLRVCAYGSLA